MSNAIFRDAALNRRFKRDGFVVVELLHAEAVAELTARAAEVLPSDPPINDPQGAAYASYFDLDRRRAASTLIRTFVEPALAQVLVGYRPLFSTFFWKPANGPDTSIHQHSPYTSNVRDRVIDCWCPLIDCSDGSGALQIVPRSHWLTGHVQVPMRPAYWQGFANLLRTDYLETIAVAAGQAVLFDDTMPHGAAANKRPVARLATLTTMVPQHGRPAYVVGDEDENDLVTYVAADEFAYSDMFHDRLPPRDEWQAAGERVSTGCDWIDAAEFRRRLSERGVLPRSHWRRRVSRASRSVVEKMGW